MNLIELTSLDDERLVPYNRLTEAQLRNVGMPGVPAMAADLAAAAAPGHLFRGCFICESPKVIAVALRAGYRPLSMLCERRHIDGDAAPLLAMMPEDIEVFTGDRELLARLTGYTLTRGVLCAMERPSLPSASELLARVGAGDGKRRVAVIDNVVDNANVGAIFRSAAALGIDAVLLTRTSCDPLNRRSVRVSMGSVFLVPWTFVDSYDEIAEAGYRTVAMALRHDSVTLDSPVLDAEPRLAIIMGNEGDGLPLATIDRADYVARIPMAHEVDSLNVAAAAAVAFWQLRK